MTIIFFFYFISYFFQALGKLRGPVAKKILDSEVEQLAEEKRAHDDESEFSYVTLVKNPVLRKALIVSVM